MSIQCESKKTSFLKWLDTQQILKNSSRAIIAAFDDASNYGITHGLIRISFWELNDASAFIESCKKLLSNKAYRVIHKSYAIILERNYYRYIEFLNLYKENEDAQQTVETSSKDVAGFVENNFVIDFDHIENLAYTKPVSIFYFEEELPSPSSWKDVYVLLVGILRDEYPHIICNGFKLGNRPGPEFGNSKTASDMIAPAIIGEAFCVETNYSATDFIKRIKKLLDLCLIDYENVVIRFIKKALEPGDEPSSSGDGQEEWIICALRNKRIEYQDKRGFGGCLWIVGGHDLDAFISECRKNGYTFYFKSDGCNLYPSKKVWWTKDFGKKVFERAKPPYEGDRIPSPQPGWIKYDFSNAKDFERTTPVYCNVNGTEVAGKSWARILIAIVELELSQGNSALTNLYKAPLFSNKGNRPFLMTERIDGLNCSELSNGYWVNVNWSIPRLMEIIQALCLKCGYSKDQILLYGVKKAIDEPRKTNERTILEAVIIVLQESSKPLSLQQIHQEILDRQLYEFNTTNSIGMVQNTVYRHCSTTIERKNRGSFAIVKIIENGQIKYRLPFIDEKPREKQSGSYAVATEIRPERIDQAETYVLSSDLNGLTFEELSIKLNESVIGTKRIVQSSTNIVVVNDHLIHKTSFMDWDEGANQLEVILDKLMQKNDGYVSDAQLYEYARVEMELFLNDNDMDDPHKVYDLAEHLFSKEIYHGKRYSFSGKTHISRCDESVDTNLDIFIKFARSRDGFFSETELEEHLKGLGVKTSNLRLQMRVYKKPLFFFYKSGEFVFSGCLNINEEWFAQMRSAIKKLFGDVGDHIVLRDIQPYWYALLPSLPGARSWTPLLLQSILMHYGDRVGAKTIPALAGQTGDTLHAMLVALESPIKTFADAVIATLLDADINQREFEAEELRKLLVTRGLITGNELIFNMSKAVPSDDRFVWDTAGANVTIKI